MSLLERAGDRLLERVIADPLHTAGALVGRESRARPVERIPDHGSVLGIKAGPPRA